MPTEQQECHPNTERQISGPGLIFQSHDIPHRLTISGAVPTGGILALQVTCVGSV